MAIAIGESERQRVDILGRERPPQFQSLWAEILFVYSIVASQFMAVSRTIFFTEPYPLIVLIADY